MKFVLLVSLLAFATGQSARVVDCCCAFCQEEGMERSAPPPPSGGDC